jgi:hypothetical protein
MKRFYVRRLATDRWAIWDRDKHREVSFAPTKRRAQDTVNSMNYWTNKNAQDST